jgi:hypothetical protein
MGLFFFPICAFFAVFVLCQRSIGLGVLASFAIGYFSGVTRANYQSVATTFFFDGGVLGLYFSVFLGHTFKFTQALRSSTGQICLLLVAWPAFLTLVPVNHFLVQLVALRGTIWLLPFVLIASQLKKKDFLTLAIGIAVLNLITLAVSSYLYVNGVPSLYPKNEVTRIIYNSADVAGGYFRIPSTFLSAHAYGGTMVLSMPFLLGPLVNRQSSIFLKTLLAAGLIAAIFGVLMCAARQPLWALGLIVIATWAQTGFSVKFGAALAVLVAIGLYLISTDERFQRGMTLDIGDGDKMYTLNRVSNSINEGLLETFLKYPFGAGMGSSQGTNLPYFLAKDAPSEIGAENEYSRIQVDQGWVGLGLWLFFLYWCHFPLPKSTDKEMGFYLSFLHSSTGLFWATAFIGTGTLQSIPQSALMLTAMGIVVSQRELERKKIRNLRRLKLMRQKIGNVGEIRNSLSPTAQKTEVAS